MKRTGIWDFGGNIPINPQPKRISGILGAAKAGGITLIENLGKKKIHRRINYSGLYNLTRGGIEPPLLP